MTTRNKLLEIIHSNPSLFDLKFKDWNGKESQYDTPSNTAFNIAEINLKLFEKRQSLILKRTKLSCGDWVHLKDGRKERITVDSFSDSIQVGGNKNGSFYISKSGNCSYSGGCGDLIKIKNLKNTYRYKEGLCWIFSEDWIGAHRSVNTELKFKIWKEK